MQSCRKSLKTKKSPKKKKNLQNEKKIILLAFFCLQFLFSIPARGQAQGTAPRLRCVISEKYIKKKTVQKHSRGSAFAALVKKTLKI